MKVYVWSNKYDARLMFIEGRRAKEVAAPNDYEFLGEMYFDVRKPKTIVTKELKIKSKLLDFSNPILRGIPISADNIKITYEVEE
jgi:hypothetical protein